ncbi:NAD-dependent epimerase/dehydratase family protein [Hwangdonia lutea]|uniref:NAD-dependent epimerase/dehydratase family protein n=1 Tax=Hwangdonia lutea TaxID=3075823 RepID=A0AA97EPD2_9FLAO|nr:NAD-dependent epimerase/dehydratase family protein [Hwangdonia sp. SCSIO 19198]WOD45116.1 NAD-dependent epimerase/dehydratase family protein [Hwangdonia sp. SCSIO 19198]
MKTERILITGASGQLGTVLTKALQEKYGIDSVIASDLRENPNFEGHFEVLDVTNYDALQDCVIKYKITQVYHLAAILSANGEQFPLKTWDINMSTLFNVLEVSRLHGVNKLFYPSSIAVFGDEVECINTPQTSNLTPLTVYGMSKAAGENWVNYYHKKYGMDIRSLRYPGVIGYQSLPGGGTTDYAVDIYHKAVKEECFDCFLEATTMLPMIFMDDAIRATIELMDAPAENIKIRTSYNLAGMSFTAEQVCQSIKDIYPNFEINYKPDFRQDIAKSWPDSVDDSAAREDWGWKPKYDLSLITKEMIENIKTYYQLTTKI